MSVPWRRIFQSFVWPVAGGLVIIALFVFGLADDILVRAVYALAGGAIAAILTGRLNLPRREGFQASGGLAVFLVLMFAEDIGTIKDSVTGKPTAPHVPRTVSISKSQFLYQAEIASAQFEFSQEHYNDALEILLKARQRYPHEPLALHMIGAIHFKLERYSEAAEAFAAGFAKGGMGQGRFAYNAALAYDAIYSPAAQLWVDRARDAQVEHRGDYRQLWRDTVHLRGVTYALKGVGASPVARHELFREAFESFQQFRDADGKPTVWANYNMACMHAVNAISGDHPSVSYDKSVEHFREFLDGLPRLPKINLKGSIVVARKVLMEPAAQKSKLPRGPGEARECRAIRVVWEKNKNEWREALDAITLAEKRAAETTEDEGRQPNSASESEHARR